MTRKEFKENYIEPCMFRGEIRVNDVIFNEGKIYNPRVNGGQAYYPVGKDAVEKTTGILWHQVKKNGGKFEFKESIINIYEEEI